MNSDEAALTHRLNVNLPTKHVLLNEQESEPKALYAEQRILLQARAWWGMLAYHKAGLHTLAGMYWYGHYLSEFPLPDRRILKEPHYQYALSEAKKSGAYWLRRLAIQHRHPKARADLMGRSSWR